MSERVVQLLHLTELKQKLNFQELRELEEHVTEEASEVGRMSEEVHGSGEVR